MTKLYQWELPDGKTIAVAIDPAGRDIKPLMSRRLHEAKLLGAAAQQVADMTREPVKLVGYTLDETIEILTPRKRP